MSALTKTEKSQAAHCPPPRQERTWFHNCFGRRGSLGRWHLARRSQEADLRALSSVLSPVLGRRHTPETLPTRVRSQHLSLTVILPMPRAAPGLAASADQNILKREHKSKVPC